MSKRLHIGNLSYNVTDDDLQQAFGAIGECTSATVIKDRDTGRSRGFGFVEMATDDGARQAIDQLDGHELKGRPIKVSEARERDAGRGGSGRR